MIPLICIQPKFIHSMASKDEQCSNLMLVKSFGLQLMISS